MSYPLRVREPYRETYRVERRTRELSEAERAVVRGHVDDWDRRARTQYLTPPKRMFVAAVLAVPVAVLGVARGNDALLATALIASVICAAISFFGRRDALRLVGLSRGPWHPPPEGWHVIETQVFARSVVGAVSDDEDYAHWLLYEVPGGTWFYLDPYGLGTPPAELARAELRFIRLAPWGPFLSATWTGDAIALRGASDGPDGSEYAAAVEAGYVWRPDEAPQTGESVAEGLVAETALPSWVRELTRTSER